MEIGKPAGAIGGAAAAAGGRMKVFGKRLVISVVLTLVVMSSGLTSEVEGRSEPAVVLGEGGESSRSLHGRFRVHGRQQSTMAYATLLYGDEFLLGVRVLGKSIRDTGTTKDMVALVSKGVSADAMDLLEADGWIVTQIELLANPNSDRPARFWGVYTKLKIFNMTNYEKVVFLDADTIVMQSIEDLFECQNFCATLKHSERFNSGVMVVEPSTELFEDMFSKVGTLRSYTGGDQGFLNSYYEDFANAWLFNPSMSPEERKAYTPKMERLSTLYNADVGLYVLANKWMVDDTSELRVIHYTLGPLKPWDWWTHWLLKPVDSWQDIRVTLPESRPGTRAGQTPSIRWVVRIMLLLPLVVMAFTNRHNLYQLCYQFAPGSTSIYTAITSWVPSNTPAHQHATGGGGSVSSSTRLPTYLGSISIIICFSSLLLSLGIPVLLIPNQVMPWTGMILTYEWTFFGFILLFGKYLDLVRSYARKSAVTSFATSPSTDGFLDYNSAKGHTCQVKLWDMETLFYGFGIAALAVAVPSISFVLGVTPLVGRLVWMGVVGAIFTIFLTYSAWRLASRWYLRGRDEGNQLP